MEQMESVQRLATRLMQVRHQRFVGRRAELELLRSALTGDSQEIALIYIYGPGGVGKTSLLHECAYLAAVQGRACVRLDSRDFNASQEAFERVLRQALGEEEDCELAEALAARPNLVLLVDTYEQLAALDGWLRNVFLPQLPQGALAVLAGRNPPDEGWRSDEGWRTLGRFEPLANLPPDDCYHYMAARGIPADAQAAVLAFTRGHPLALSLVADLYQREPAPAAVPEHTERDVIQLLVQRFLRDAPSDLHRAALELCAIALATTEDLLAARFGAQAGHELFRWLCGLTLIEQGPGGVFPHDLARDVIAADLYWRNPAAYAGYQQTILTYLRQRHWRSRGYEQQRYGLDMLFVNRQAPGMKEFFAWDEMADAFAEPAGEDDFGAILEMVRRHEGEASCAIARHWQERQPRAFLAYRRNDGKLYGFMAQLALQWVTQDDRDVDPGVDAVLRYMEAQRPLAEREAGSLMRFWMASETYQAISPAVNLSAANCVIYWRTTPNLVWSFVAMAHPEFMAPHFESIRFPRTPAADFMVGGRVYGVFSHDWAADPVRQWQVDTKHADEASLAETTARPAAQPPAALSDEDFAAAVRQAMRDYTRPDLLATNVLLQSVQFQTALAAGSEATPAALQAWLRGAVTSYSHSPKDMKFYRALWHTYIEPAPTQEQTAELLDLPFNTYRYHLNTGLRRLIEGLRRATTR